MMKRKKYIKPTTEQIHVIMEHLLGAPSDSLKQTNNEIRDSESQTATTDIQTGSDTEGEEGGFNGAKGHSWNLWEM